MKFSAKSFMSLTLQHNRLKFLTNRNIACFDLVPYHIYTRVILAFSPKMAPMSKKHGKQGYGAHPSIDNISIDLLVLYSVQ